MHIAGSEPSYDSMLPALTQLNAKVVSVPSLDGDGFLGHLILTIGHTAHLAISTANIPHPAPPAVGTIPVIPANATGPLIAKLHQQHPDHKRNFQLYQKRWMKCQETADETPRNGR